MVTSDIGAIVFYLLTFNLGDIIDDNKDMILTAERLYREGNQIKCCYYNGHDEMVMRAGGTLTNSEFKGEN